MDSSEDIARAVGVTLNGKSIWPGSHPGCFCTSVVANADDPDG
jgi:hypothetical protein